MDNWRNNSEQRLNEEEIYSNQTPDYVALRDNVEATTELLKAGKKDEAELKDVVEMKNMAWNFISYMDKEYSWQDDYQNQKNKFLKRIRNFGAENLQKWDNNLFEWYKKLLNALTEKDYFKNLNEKEKKEKLNQVRQLYGKKIFNQYKKYVRDSNDWKFNEIKGKLFWESNTGYTCPADEVFYDLTGAATMDSNQYGWEKWYTFEWVGNMDNVDYKNQNDNPEKWSDEKKRNFLSKDVPEQLWGIKNVSWRKKLLSGLGIAKINRPSEQEKKAIRSLLEASTKLKLNPSDNRDKAIVLLETFKNVPANTSPKEYENILREQGITIEEKRLKKLPLIWKEFIESSKNNWSIYISIIEIIQQYNWVDGAINVLYPYVSQAKQNKKIEKDEKYSEWKALDKIQGGNEIKRLARNLWIEDFTSVTRLVNLPDKYFKDNSIWKILANLNNDDRSDLGDAVLWWLKAWQQFFEIYNYIWEETALNNLLERAKLINKSLELGLSEDEFDWNQIKAWNKKLILLLQEIILRPGEDLYTLLSGNSEIQSEEYSPKMIVNFGDENGVTEQDFTDLENMIVAYAEEKTKDNNGNDQSSEMIQRLLAENAQNIKEGYLIYAGNKIPLSDIASIGWWVDQKGQAWLAFTLKKTSDLWKNWSVTPSMSVWGFVWLWKIWWWVDASIEFAKRWVNNNWTTHRVGFGTGATVTFTGVPILHAWINYSRNKLDGIDERWEALMWEMKEELKDRLKSIKDKLPVDNKKMDFNNSDLVTKVIANELLDMAKDLDIKKDEDINKAVNATMRLLMVYNNQDLSQDGVIESIAQWVAEQYAMAWIEAKKNGVKDKRYFAGASLWAFWVVGTPIVWVNVWVSFNKHFLEGVKDQNINRYNGDATLKIIDQDRVAELNRQLGLKEWEGLTLSADGEMVVIPNWIKRDIKVSDDMEWMMIKDDEGVKLSKFTTITSNVNLYTTTHKRELLIWEWPDFNQTLNNVPEGRFTNENNLWQKSIEKINETRFYTLEWVKNAIKWFKETQDVNKLLDNYNPTDKEIQEIVTKLNSFQDKTKIANITIKRDGESFKAEVKQSENDWIWIELQYGLGNPELFNEDANKLAEFVYSRAATLKNPVPLRSVKHPANKSHPDYEKFVWYLTWSAKNLQSAKNTLIEIITKMNKQIRQPDNPLDISEKSWPTDDVALEQVLLSINNVFARTQKVRWVSSGSDNWINRYEFKWYNGKKHKDQPMNMSAIIKEREGQLKWTINAKVSDKWVAKLYSDLIDASAEYRERTRKFEIKQSSAEHLHNAVGFNLWDRRNPENPLLNPEIYTDMIDLNQLNKNKFSEKNREDLHKHAIEMFVKNSALFEPIKKNFGITDNGSISFENSSRDEKNKTMSVNVKIWKETITLTTGMKVGYFTQCVNHTIILDEITVTHNWITQKYETVKTRGDQMGESTIKAKYGTEQLNLEVGVSRWQGAPGVESEPDSGSETPPVAPTITNGLD